MFWSPLASNDSDGAALSTSAGYRPFILVRQVVVRRTEILPSVWRWDIRLDLVASLHEDDSQASVKDSSGPVKCKGIAILRREVPIHVAMQVPRSSVVGNESDGYIVTDSVPTDVHNIAPHWVGVVVVS